MSGQFTVEKLQIANKQLIKMFNPANQTNVT